MKKQLLAAATLFAVVAAPAAYADTIYLGLQVGGGSITPVSSSTTGLLSYTDTAVGPLSSLIISATGTPLLNEPSLDSNSLSATATTNGTISVYITETGLSALAFAQVLSSFTTNTTTTGGATITVTESTYAANCATSTCTSSDAFNTTQQLSSFISSDTGNFSDNEIAPLPSALEAPYTVTEVFTIAVTGGSSGSTSSTNDTINLSSVPEPTSLALLGTCLGGLGMVFRRGRKTGFAG